MKTPILIIGNKNYSSWSLRGWLALRKAGVDFREHRLCLDTPEFTAQIGNYSPARRVPVLHDGELRVWDSLAIAEYANEKWADGRLWPTAVDDRGYARALAAEMHSGFPVLRAALPMDIRATGLQVAIDPALQLEIDRILSIWCECRSRYGAAGPWLFGSFSITDALFAPVVFRFLSYDVTLPQPAADYVRTVGQDHDIREWVEAAKAEKEVLA